MSSNIRPIARGITAYCMMLEGYNLAGKGGADIGTHYNAHSVAKTKATGIYKYYGHNNNGRGRTQRIVRRVPIKMEAKRFLVERSIIFWPLSVNKAFMVFES
jgi:hypothetical protein